MHSSTPYTSDSALLILSSRPSVRRYYLIALILTVALISTSLFVLISNTARQGLIPEFLDTITSQGQGGETVALLAAQLMDADEQNRDPIHDEMMTVIASMRGTHDALTNGALSAKAGLNISSEDRERYFAGNPGTDAMVEDYLQLADDVAALPSQAASDQAPSYLALIAYAPQVRDRLNEIAGAYQLHIERQTIQEYDTEVAVIILIILIVLAEIPIIFIPMERRIRRQNALMRREIVFQHNLAEDLRIAQGKLSAVLDSNPQAVSFFDAQYKIVRVNKVSAEISFGISGKVPQPGDSIFDFIRPSMHEMLRSCFDSALRGQMLQIENSVVINGSQHIFKMVFFPVMVDGKIDGGAFAQEDITERKHAEHQAQELIAERERVRVLAGFVQAASHEFRTPLTIINSSAYVLERLIEDEKGKQRAKLILGQTDHIMMLIGALIRMAELDSVTHLPIERLNLTPIVHAASNSVAASFADRNVEIILDVPSPMIAYVNATQMEYSLTELMTNAMNAMPEKGRITVKIWTDESNLVIEVCDTGTGVSATHIPRLFERFYRVDAARTTRGFGLGLSTVQRIARLHNGDLEVESIEGKGSTFRMVLPNLTFGENPTIPSRRKLSVGA